MRTLKRRKRVAPPLGTVVQARFGARRAGIVVAHGPRDDYYDQPLFVKWIDQPEVSEVALANVTTRVDAVLRLAVLGMVS